MVSNFLESFFNRQIGVDFGSAKLRMSLPPHESVLSEPNVLVRNRRTNQVVAFGREAKDLRGRTPDHFSFERPIHGGVVETPKAAVTLLSLTSYQHRTVWESVFGQSFLVAVPATAVDTEVRSFGSVFNRVGGRQINAVPAEVAGLVGVGAAIDDPLAQMVIDVGSDTTNVGIVSNRSLISADARQLAGRALDRSIQNYIQRELNLRISELQAQTIKHDLATLDTDTQRNQKSVTVYGQDTASRLPREVAVSAEDIRKAIRPTIDDLTAFVQDFLQSASADTAADIYTHGVHLVGGTAGLPGLADELEKVLSVSVYEYDEPERAVIRGVGSLTQRDELTQSITQFNSYAPANS